MLIAATTNDTLLTVLIVLGIIAALIFIVKK